MPGEIPPAAPMAQARGMDAISAHLDRGWDLLQRNDFAGAQRSASEVLKLDARSPEAYTLLGAIAAAQGHTDEALQNYEQAMELDPDFIDPLLYAAETFMWPLEDYEQALELCVQALEIAEEEDEFLDALLLKAEAELGLGDDEAALRTLEELPPVDFPEPVYHLRAARTLLDLGQGEAAMEHYERALERDPSLTEAVHGLGLCAEERGDREALIRHFLKVWELDQKEPQAPWGISPERFEELCTQILTELPERIRTLLANVPLVASDYPSRELVAEGSDPRMLGLFAGVPYPDKQNVGGTPHLDCIFLYQRNIERVARSVAEVELEIKKTIVHEAGHFFGLSEEELDDMGLG
jgi:tetratricopeptide (TPR) repeat protein